MVEQPLLCRYHDDLLGFNGECPDPMTGHYLLGNGYRAFNPVLMRFNSPDNLSPFGKGGINAYAYCQGDPVNRTDPSGHWFGIPGRIALIKTVSAVAGVGFLATLTAGLAVQDNQTLKAGLIVGSIALGAVGTVGAFKVGWGGPRVQPGARTSVISRVEDLPPPRYSLLFAPPPRYSQIHRIRQSGVEETPL